MTYRKKKGKEGAGGDKEGEEEMENDTEEKEDEDIDRTKKNWLGKERMTKRKWRRKINKARKRRQDGRRREGARLAGKTGKQVTRR